jgi:hypothetical protein
MREIRFAVRRIHFCPDSSVILLLSNPTYYLAFFGDFNLNPEFGNTRGNTRQQG